MLGLADMQVYYTNKYLTSSCSLLGSFYPGCFIWEENGYIMMGEKQRRGWGSADLALFSILNRIAM